MSNTSIDGTDRFAIIAPMRPSTVDDDTEQGIPLTSAIVEQSKRKQRILTAEEDLAYQPVKFSNMNHIARQRLEQKSQPPKTSGHQPSPQRQQHGGDSEVTRDELDEPVVLVLFQSNVPIHGKTSFTVSHCMSDPVSHLRTALIQHCLEGAVGHRRPPTGPVTIHRSDTGEQLPLTATLLSLGFRFPPLLRVHNFYHEIYLVCAEPLGIRMPVPWSPTMTVTDLLEQVSKRLAPRDLRHVRLSKRTHATSNDKKEDAAFLDTGRCFVPQVPRYLAARDSLCALGFCASQEDPVGLTFIRPKDGCPWLYQVPFTGQWTLSDVARFLVSDVCESGDGGEGYLIYPCGSASSTPSRNDPFDDDDEEVFFEGADGAAGRHRGDDSYRGVFRWTHGEVGAVYGEAAAKACGGYIVSFCPPPSALQSIRPPLRFVPIHEDFGIPHLSDLRILPGDEVLVEYFDSMSGRWSGELTNAVTRLLPAAWDEAQRHLYPNHELITIRSIADGSLVRVPCTPTTSIESILWMYFMATGYLPMFGELLTDNGNVLGPFQTLASANLLPQTTLFYLHRRRQWLREGIPDLDRQEALKHSKLFTGAPSPSL
jgi:hypothetical protein